MPWPSASEVWTNVLGNLIANQIEKWAALGVLVFSWGAVRIRRWRRRGKPNPTPSMTPVLRYLLEQPGRVSRDDLRRIANLDRPSFTLFAQHLKKTGLVATDLRGRYYLSGAGTQYLIDEKLVEPKPASSA